MRFGSCVRLTHSSALSVQEKAGHCTGPLAPIPRMGRCRARVWHSLLVIGIAAPRSARRLFALRHRNTVRWSSPAVPSAPTILLRRLGSRLSNSCALRLKGRPSSVESAALRPRLPAFVGKSWAVR